MSPCAKPWVHIGAFALMLLAAPCVQAQPAAVQPSLVDARHAVVTAENELRKALSESKKACDKADAADAQLLREGLTPSTLTQTLAQDARGMRQSCDRWKQVASQAQAVAAAARVQLQDVAASAAPASAPASGARGASRLPARIDLQNLVDQAQQAQVLVDKERTAAQGVYDTVDRATKAALALTLATDAPTLDRARAMQGQAKAARRAGSGAQTAANDLVEHALVIRACLIT